MADTPQRKQEEKAPGTEEGQAQARLAYLRGPAGERDRVTLWKLGRGTLPGTADGGLLEGWLENGR